MPEQLLPLRNLKGRTQMIVLTGDTHGDFERIFEFCDEYETTTEDVMVGYPF